MRRQRAARTALLTGLGVFLGLQLALAALLVWGLPWLREANYGHKLNRLRDSIARQERKPLTVVMLGSSRTVYGLKGSTLEAELTAIHGRPVVLYNFGFFSAGPATSLLNLRRLIEDGIRPDLLLVEVLPALLDDQPMTDLDEDHCPTAGLRRPELNLVQHFAGDFRPVHRRDWWLGWALPAYYHRFALVSHTLPILLSYSQRQDGFLGADNSGWIPVQSALQTVHGRQEALELARKQYQERLAHFRPGAAKFEALRETLALCRQEKVPAALVLLPEGPIFRGWYPPAIRAQINTALEQLHREMGVDVVDARDWIDNEEAFLDSHHLLPHGAEVFTRLLARQFVSPRLARLTCPPGGTPATSVSRARSK